MIPCAWKPQVPPPKAGHSEQLLQAIIITLCDVWPFFSGWTMAAHPGSFSSCCPESCSTRTMDCLSTLPLTATLCKSAHSRPLWRTLMNGQRTCRKYSSETLGFWDHASLIWPVFQFFFSLFLWEVQMQEKQTGSENTMVGLSGSACFDDIRLQILFCFVLVLLRTVLVWSGFRLMLRSNVPVNCYGKVNICKC